MPVIGQRWAKNHGSTVLTGQVAEQRGPGTGQFGTGLTQVGFGAQVGFGPPQQQAQPALGRAPVHTGLLQLVANLPRLGLGANPLERRDFPSGVEAVGGGLQALKQAVLVRELAHLGFAHLQQQVGQAHVAPHGGAVHVEPALGQYQAGLGLPRLPPVHGGEVNGLHHARRPALARGG